MWAVGRGWSSGPRGPTPQLPAPSLPLRAPVTCLPPLPRLPLPFPSARVMVLGPPVAQDRLPVLKSAAWQLSSICEVPPRWSGRCPPFTSPGFPNMALLGIRATEARASEGQGPDLLRVGSEGSAQERRGDADVEKRHRGAGGRGWSGVSTAQGHPGRQDTASPGPWRGATWVFAAFEFGFPQ